MIPYIDTLLGSRILCAIISLQVIFSLLSFLFFSSLSHHFFIFFLLSDSPIFSILFNPLSLSVVWVVIARCDGGSGQLLGQAVATGLDGIRAWICAVLLFSSR